MTKELKLSDVSSPLRLRVTNRNLSLFSVRDLIVHADDYSFDFDVYLPSKKMNLQRDLCWTLLQKQELILSILKGLRLPPVSVIHRDHTKYYVIDGKQRLCTILQFIHGEFALEVNNHFYFLKDFDENCRYKFMSYDIVGDVAYEYTDDDPVLFSDDDKIQWFTLLNFSGTQQDKAHLNKLTGC